MTFLDLALLGVPCLLAGIALWRIDGDSVEKFLSALLVLVISGVISFIVAMIVDDVYAEKFELRKDSWGCTRSHEETTQSTYYLYVGGVQMPQTTYGTETVCDQWSRKS